MTAPIVANPSDLTTEGGSFNVLDFVIDQKLSDVWTALPVLVVSCTNAGGLTQAGTVSVLPLVNMIDGQGKPTQHGIINGLTYYRMQGGTNAVIMDPVAGDKGFAVFCHRDISSVKATGKQSNPGSFRRFDPADGIYIGGILNGVPTQYVQFSPTGISVVSPTAVQITAPTTTITGSLVVTGNATIDGRSFIGHEHSGVQGGSSNTGPVV